MSFPFTTTFRDMVVQVANGMGRAYDQLATSPIDELAVTMKSKIAGFSNTAMNRLWRNPNPAFAWKWTTTGALLTLQSNGSILWSDIQYSDDWFSMWSQDPRPLNNPPNGNGWWAGNPAWPVMCVEDNDAIWPRINQTNVWCFWRIPRPVFTSRLVNTGSTYNTIGTLVWDELVTGVVYKSIATGALGNALTDTAKWTPQNIPERLADVMAEMVQTMILQADGADGSSMVNDKEAQTWLDFEMSKENPRDGSGPPWAYDRRFTRLCSGWFW